MSTTCVYNDDLKVLRLELVHSFPGNLHWIYFCVTETGDEIEVSWVYKNSTKLYNPKYNQYAYFHITNYFI